MDEPMAAAGAQLAGEHDKSVTERALTEATRGRPISNVEVAADVGESQGQSCGHTSGVTLQRIYCQTYLSG